MATTYTNAVNAATYCALAAIAPDGRIPTFEECKAYEQLPNNSRVRPEGHTKNELSYGYTRGTCFYWGNELRVRVYWPEIRSSGDWPVSQLTY